jgi:hypothetical protein
MPQLKLTATGGFNYFDVVQRLISGETNGGLVVPHVYNLANSKDRASAEQDHFHRRILGALGSVTFGWDDKIFLTYSARNDWSSTLPADNQSFFYQAVGVSGIVSDYLNLEESAVNYIKLRADYEQPVKTLEYINSAIFTKLTRSSVILVMFTRLSLL